MAPEQKTSEEDNFIMGNRVTSLCKEIVDRILAITMSILFFPIFVLISAVIKLSDPRHPIFFQQEVMGKNRTKFNFLKFRTMEPHEINYDLRKNNSDSKHGEVRLDDPRVTRLGRWLRRLKLDEIPQFLHVLSGKMSFVGPRPMDPIRFDHSDEFERQRLLVKPGLTGLAQVTGNTKKSWEERMQMDIWYIANWTIALDIKIFFMTLGVVLFGERIRHSYHTRKITDHTFRLMKDHAPQPYKVREFASYGSVSDQHSKL